MFLQLAVDAALANGQLQEAIDRWCAIRDRRKFTVRLMEDAGVDLLPRTGPDGAGLSGAAFYLNFTRPFVAQMVNTAAGRLNLRRDSRQRHHKRLGLAAARDRMYASKICPTKPTIETQS
jgi:hypothetical protein